MEPNKRKKYELELRRLDEEFVDLQQHWEHVPRFAWFALSAPLAWIAHGFGTGMVALLVSAALLATRGYLIGVRKSENRWIRASVAREIDGDVDDRGPHAVRAAAGYGHG
jgi:hypothetical protein